MTRPIDLSGMFRAHVAERLRVAGQIDEDAADALADALYAEWTDAPDARLDGLSPRAWMARLTTGEAAVELLCAYAHEHMEVPELLLERMDALGAACVGPLEALLRDGEACACVRAQALDALLGIDETAALRAAVDAVLASGESDEMCELAAEALGERADEAARERLLAGYEGASAFAQMLVLEILCNFPGDGRVYARMVDMLKNRPDQRAFAAKLLGRYGDARALEPLMRLLPLSDLNYFEYMEIRNAVEALGGEVEQEREFYGDPDYEYLRSME